MSEQTLIARIESETFPRCATEIRIYCDKEPAFVVSNGACHLQTYPTADELRKLGAACLSAADALEAAQ